MAAIVRELASSVFGPFFNVDKQYTELNSGIQLAMNSVSKMKPMKIQ